MPEASLLQCRLFCHLRAYPSQSIPCDKSLDYLYRLVRSKRHSNGIRIVQKPKFSNDANLASEMCEMALST